MRKDSRSRWGWKKPQLARHYEVSSNEIFDHPVFVAPKDYWQFQRAEKELAGMNIFPKDYAFGISKHLKEWVWGKGWFNVPLNVFCGQWAIKTYSTELFPVKFLETPTEVVDQGELLYDELLVARYYIDSSGKMSLDEVAEMLRPILKESWLELFANHKRSKVVTAALEILSMEKGRLLESYEDLI